MKNTLTKITQFAYEEIRKVCDRFNLKVPKPSSSSIICIHIPVYVKCFFFSLLSATLMEEPISILLKVSKSSNTLSVDSDESLSKLLILMNQVTCSSQFSVISIFFNTAHGNHWHFDYSKLHIKGFIRRFVAAALL